MPSATADTNIYISALHFGGLPLRFLDLARAGAIRLDISRQNMAPPLFRESVSLDGSFQPVFKSPRSRCGRTDAFRCRLCYNHS